MVNKCVYLYQYKTSGSVYNSRVTQWNTDIFDWPTKMIVAASQGYTTRIPFSVSAETREKARSKFF